MPTLYLKGTRTLTLRIRRSISFDLSAVKDDCDVTLGDIRESQNHTLEVMAGPGVDTQDILEAVRAEYGESFIDPIPDKLWFVKTDGVSRSVSEKDFDVYVVSMQKMNFFTSGKD